MSSRSDAELKITRAKTALVIEQPFFAQIALSLKFMPACDYVGEALAKSFCNTMATDGRHCFWDEEFVNKHSLSEIIGVVCHEVLHVVYQHMFRRGDRIPKIWNIACDYVINQICLDAGFKLPKNGCFNPKYKGWLVEAVYEDLMQNHVEFIKFKMPGEKGDGDGEGEDMWGIFMEPKNDDGQPMSDAEKNEMIHEIKTMVQQAAAVAKSIGKLPGGLENVIEAISEPTVNWQDYIQSWVSGRIPDDYSWRRPNRKMMANHGIYMPRMELHGCGTGILSVDVSGSVSDAELRKYVSEFTGIIEGCNPDKLYIVQHDAIIQKIDVWEGNDDVIKSMKVKGRGGTNITPSFKWAQGDLEIKGVDGPDQVDWMICFTDMGISDYPKIAPDFPVLWAATGPDNAPFGTYIPVKDALSRRT